MKRIIAPVVLGATALTLSACGGGSSSHASSGAKAAANVKSAASSPVSPSSSSSSAALIDDATLKSYAKKLGCGDLDVKTNPAPKAKQAGAATAINCHAGSTEYILVRTTDSSHVEKVVTTVFGGDSSSRGIPYVAGTNWMVLGAKNSEDKPSMADATTIKDKLGGEIKTMP